MKMRNLLHSAFPKIICLFLPVWFLYCTVRLYAQDVDGNEKSPVEEQQTIAANNSKVLYGTASFYADKFIGRQTASGENYDHKRATAACNVLPIGTWIRVTSLKNSRSVVVRVNDRLHPKMKRLVDLNKSSAEKLGYVKRGLEKVRVEVVSIKKT